MATLIYVAKNIFSALQLYKFSAQKTVRLSISAASAAQIA